MSERERAEESASAKSAVADTPAVRLKDAWKIYTLGQTKVEAVRGVNITIKEGDFASIPGPTGRGRGAAERA